MNTCSAIPVEIVEIRRFQPAARLKEEENPDFISTSELFNAVYENAFHPMYIGNGGGKFIKFNEKFSKLFGFSRKEMSEINLADIFKTDDNSFIKFMNERNEKGIAKAEVRCFKKSGESFPCRISSIIYEADNGEKRSLNTLVNISNNILARWNVE